MAGQRASCPCDDGLTLPELLISLCLWVILVSVAMPHFLHYLHRKEQQNYINTLKLLLTYSRHYALQHQETVVLCPSEDQNHCMGNWQQGAILFVDRHGDREFHSDDLLLRIVSPPPAHQHLMLSAFPNNRSLQFQPKRTLIAQSSSGSFKLCNLSDHQQLRLVFSNTGRLREEASVC